MIGAARVGLHRVDRLIGSFVAGVLGVEAERLVFRRAYAQVFSASLREGVLEGSLPPQDPSLTAVALVGAIGEVLTQPHDADEDALVASLVRFCLRSITEETHVHHRAA